MSIVVTSGIQKKTNEAPTAEMTRAIQWRALWLKYRNCYPESERQRPKILDEEFGE